MDRLRLRQTKRVRYVRRVVAWRWGSESAPSLVSFASWSH